jgi:hypothetical protein
MATLMRLVTLTLLASFATGCLLVPIPTAIADPEPFTQENLAGIRVSVTTRAEVAAIFSDWRYTTDEGQQVAAIAPRGEPLGRWWAFPLRRQMGDVAFAGLVIYCPVPMPVLTGKEDNYETNWVVVEFDAADLVARFWITRDGAPCDPDTVCPGDEHLFVIAAQALDQSTKSAAPPADRALTRRSSAVAVT